MSILAINCGSSSVKYAVFNEALQIVARGLVEATGDAALERAMAALSPYASIARAVGHRIVHGGERFTSPTLITPHVRADIEQLIPLAPEHQPHHIAGIDTVAKHFPDLPQIACFDTAFHRTIPQHRQEMALPLEFAKLGLLRYGFHGLSYEYISTCLSKPRMIICHLGNGCSLVAVKNGKSIYTSMGFTPLDGLMMGTRAGALDPGAVLWLVDRLGNTKAVRALLNRESGLKGVSGLSSDMRDLLAADDPRARFAVTMFVDRLVLEIGRAVAALQGLDAIVFTGGIGENAATVRAAVITQLDWLGLKLDTRANAEHAAVISELHPAKEPPIPTAHVIQTNEEQMIARSVKGVLSISASI